MSEHAVSPADNDRVYVAGEVDDTPNPPSLMCRNRKPAVGSPGEYTCTRSPHTGGNHAAGTGEFIAAVWVDSDEYVTEADGPFVSAAYASVHDPVAQAIAAMLFPRQEGAR